MIYGHPLRHSAVRFALAAACCLLTVSIGARAQDRAIAAEAFGPNTSVHIVPAAAFTPASSSDAFVRDGNDYLNFTAGTSGTRFAWAPLGLPAGARIRALCAFFYDSNATYEAGLTLSAIRRGDPFGNAPIITALATVFSSNSSGYQIPCVTLDATVHLQTDQDDNQMLESWSYVLRAATDFASSSLRFGGAFIAWQRQVSDAPAQATFDDVPENHPLFPYVEALKAAGITEGCGNGTSYCPDDPVTRGQLAMWFAKALGLWWPH
jgi:hypothetical protein